MKKFKLLILFSALVTFGAHAQQDFILYNMYDVPQSIYSNPSNQFNGKFFIGIPAISSNYFSLSSSSLAYSDAIVPRGDSLLLDFDNLISQLDDENFFSFNAKLDLFSFGIHLGKRTQLSFNVTENMNFRFNYTKDFAQFVYRGNGAFDDNTANFENLGLEAYHYREYGLGISHQLNEKLRLGIRGKYLYGMENINTKTTDVSLTTNPETYELTARADVEIQTSNIGERIDLDSLDISDYLFGLDNTGFGLDLGAHYELNEKLSFNASIIDLGYINWNSYTKSYIIENGQYTYSGIEIDAFSGQTDTISRETSFDRVADSIEQAFDIKEPNESYTSTLTPRFYIGANYRFDDHTVFGGLIQNEVFKGTIRPSLTLSGHRKMTKWITLAASYTVINGSFNNLGLGVNLNPGPVQFYVISDNVIGALQPQNSRHTQVRFGINLIFGSKKSNVLHPPFDPNQLTKRQIRREEKEASKSIQAPAESDSSLVVPPQKQQEEKSAPSKIEEEVKEEDGTESNKEPEKSEDNTNPDTEADKVETPKTDGAKEEVPQAQEEKSAPTPEEGGSEDDSE